MAVSKRVRRALPDSTEERQMIFEHLRAKASYLLKSGMLSEASLVADLAVEIDRGAHLEGIVTPERVNGHVQRKASPKANTVASRKFSDISEEEFRAKVGYVTTATIEMRDDEKLSEQYPSYCWHDMEWREMIESPLFDGKYWRRLFKITSVESAKEQLLEIAKLTDFSGYNRARGIR